MKRFILRFSSVVSVMAFMLVFYGLAIKNTQETEAIRATDFKAGRIIDDEIFYNPDTMTVEQIQEHLNKYVPECDTWGKKSIGFSTWINGRYVPATTNRVEYNKMMYDAGNHYYHEPPYICIDDYYENPETHKTNFDTNGEVEEGMISAAQIIYDAAHEYSINPQVLLVTLKKESYAWTDDWPTRNEYYSVMGYACPDGADCDATYRGFYNQVMMAAWQFNYYREHIYDYGKRPYTNNQILYTTDWSCGTKTVYLENIATTSLYIYTPYTPNDAALANYPGTAHCGSYGNRNFFMYFSEWFGSTLVDDAEKLINDAYEENGGEKGVLGKAVSGLRSNDKMQWKKYQNGYIVGSKETGYHISMGSIRKTWSSLGFESGILGMPVDNERSNSRMSWQKYQNGYIVGSEKTGFYVSMGEIRKTWTELGYEKGELGLPVSNLRTNGKMDWQKYENGYIVGSKSTGYYVSIGGIRKTWAELGYETSELGLPVSNLSSNDLLTWQRYQNGFIVGSDETGYYISTGDIRRAWGASGYEDGILGRPVSNLRSNGKMDWQKYENGYIVGSKSTGYYVSTGKIREVWSSLGFENSEIGLPIGNIETKDGVTWQNYQHGYIAGNDKDGYKAVKGKAYEE